MIGSSPPLPDRNAATADASWSASGADKAVIDVPNNIRDSNSSWGSAGTLAKMISGLSPVPVTLTVAATPWTLASARMSSNGSGGLSPWKRMTPRSSRKLRPANS